MKRLALLLFVAACCPSPSATPSTPAPPPPPATTDVSPPLPPPMPLGAPPAGMRLPASVRPLSYQLELDVDPGKPAFTGRVVIELDLQEPAHPLWLNAEHLVIESAQLRAGGGVEPLRVVPGPEGVIGLAAAAPIAPGRISVEIAYRGETRDGDGVRRHHDRGDWYITTHLEPQGARRIVPCFDEPAFKVPWTLALITPAGLFAAGNAPIERDEPLPEGRRRVRFAATAPIPTYLLAFAVGPFEAVEAGTTGGGVPMRIVVPRGRQADAAYMAAQSAPLVAALEDYTGIAFPYEKLDHIVVPGQGGGAMENVGLITYAPHYLLIPPSESDDTRSVGIEIMAHELAHQWFGDLVTPVWWDDIWLNEGFATWAANRILAEHYRSLGGDLAPAQSRRHALNAEADPTARAVRQPVVERAHMFQAFDAITYEKGATLLDMFEGSLGADVFRAGVRAYLAAHRGGNATASDFIAALSASSKQDLAASLATWLDRPGAPVVSMALACPRGGPAVLELAQHRYRVEGDASAPDSTRWHVPVCVRVPDEAAPRCTQLTEATGRIELGARCPKVVIPSGRGHYRTAPSPALRAALVAAWPRLARDEQIALAGDTAALVDAGELELAASLDLLPRLGSSGNTIAVRIGTVIAARLEASVRPKDRPAFQKLVQRSFGKLARSAGWTVRPGESLLEAATRGQVVPLVTTAGRDPVMGRATLALARRWMDDHTVVPETMAGSLLQAAASLDDAALFDAMLARVTSEPDPTAKRALAGALGSTPNPARLQRVLELALAQPAIEPAMLYLLFGDERPETTPVRLAFWREHADALLAKVPEDWRAYIGPSTCLPEHREAVAALIDAHWVAMSDYGTSTRDRELAWMDACIARRAQQVKPLADYLAKHR